MGQREIKVITLQKSFPGSGSQTLFLAETSDSRKYVCVLRLNRVGKITEFGLKSGKGFGKWAAHPIKFFGDYSPLPHPPGTNHLLSKSWKSNKEW